MAEMITDEEAKEFQSEYRYSSRGKILGLVFRLLEDRGRMLDTIKELIAIFDDLHHYELSHDARLTLHDAGQILKEAERIDGRDELHNGFSGKLDN